MRTKDVPRPALEKSASYCAKYPRHEKLQLRKYVPGFWAVENKKNIPYDCVQRGNKVEAKQALGTQMI